VARGWGLGFTLVKGSVEAHGGSIRIDSAPGQGATFIIELPMDPRPFQVR
jgi:signal transduction histidine kinase